MNTTLFRHHFKLKDLQLSCAVLLITVSPTAVDQSGELGGGATVLFIVERCDDNLYLSLNHGGGGAHCPDILSCMMDLQVLIITYCFPISDLFVESDLT